MYLRKFESVRHSALFNLHILEIREPFEVGPQMRDAERSLETLPAERLCLIIASQGLHHVEAYLLPFERNPAGPLFIDSIDSGPCLLDTARLQQSLGNFSSYSRYRFSFFALLRDERIYIALSVRNFLQRKTDGAFAPARSNFVGIKRAASAPADDLAILALWLFWRCLG